MYMPQYQFLPKMPIGSFFSLCLNDIAKFGAGYLYNIGMRENNLHAPLSGTKDNGLKIAAGMM